MPYAYIKQNMTTHATRLCSTVRNLRDSISDLRELYATLVSMRDASNYSLIEEMFGLTAGDGIKVFVLVRDSLELIDALDNGQANKLQRLLNNID